jgi:hypothetical protein
MRKFGRTTVSLAEAHHKTTRAEWGLDSGPAQLNDHDPVDLYADDGQPGQYIADSGGDYLFAGAIDQVPHQWLEERLIRFYFGVSLDEFKERFCAP